MREHERVQRPDAERAERRCKHPFADVESRTRNPARIHQHRPAVGNLHQRRVALTHVEEHDPQLPGCWWSHRTGGESCRANQKDETAGREARGSGPTNTSAHETSGTARVIGGDEGP